MITRGSLPNFANPKLFPLHASPLCYEVLGWNDAASSINTILHSNRQVNTRLFKLRESLESWMSFRIAPRLSSGNYDMTQQGRQQVHNFYYQSGIEEMLLYMDDHPQSPVPRGEHYLHMTRFVPPYKLDQCDYCGKDFQEGLYVDLLILTDDVLCSLSCAQLRLKKVRAAEPWLQRFYPVGREFDRRPDCPLPEDREELALFLRSIPAKHGTDVSSSPPPIPAMQVVKKVRHEFKFQESPGPEGYQAEGHADGGRKISESGSQEG